MTGTVTKFPRKPRRARKAAPLACPEHIQGEARAEWLRLMVDPAASRLIGPENRALVELYVCAYARWRDAEAHLARHGAVVPAPRTGVPMHSPMATLAAKERDALLKLADALGITPQSRGKVEPAAKAGATGWEGLLA